MHEATAVATRIVAASLLERISGSSQGMELEREGARNCGDAGVSLLRSLVRKPAQEAGAERAQGRGCRAPLAAYLSTINLTVSEAPPAWSRQM